MLKTPREIIEKMLKELYVKQKIDTVGIQNYCINVDQIVIDIDNYYEEIRGSEQWILSRVEIDKDWVKDLLMKSGLVTEKGAERIAEGMKIYSPIKLVGEK